MVDLFKHDRLYRSPFCEVPAHLIYMTFLVLVVIFLCLRSKSNQEPIIPLTLYHSDDPNPRLLSFSPKRWKSFRSSVRLRMTFKISHSGSKLD